MKTKYILSFGMTLGCGITAYYIQHDNFFIAVMLLMVALTFFYYPFSDSNSESIQLHGKRFVKCTDFHNQSDFLLSFDEVTKFELSERVGDELLLYVRDKDNYPYVVSFDVEKRISVGIIMKKHSHEFIVEI